MHEVTTHAQVVEGEALEDQFVVTFSRRELEALRDASDPAQLWLELEKEGNGGPKRIAIDLSTGDVEHLLQHPNGDDLMIALDGYALNGLFDDAEVEAHGLRNALAIAVVVAAAAAPAGVAATPQAQSPAASAQKAGAAATVQQSPAASVQRATAASRVQAAKPAASVQASKPAATVAAKPGAKPQVSRTAAKPQISTSLILKANGIQLFRSANR
jgi:hypothetical protein